MFFNILTITLLQKDSARGVWLTQHGKHQLQRNLETILCGQQHVLSGQTHHSSRENKRIEKKPNQKAIYVSNSDFLLINQRRYYFQSKNLTLI